MSEFLLIKSSEEQLLSEDSGSPVDTAYVTERDGLPILRAVFDVHHFHPDEVRLLDISLFNYLYMFRKKAVTMNNAHAWRGSISHTDKTGRTITRSSVTAKSTARPSCLVGVLHDISREKICWWLINRVVQKHQLLKRSALTPKMFPYGKLLYDKVLANL